MKKLYPLAAMLALALGLTGCAGQAADAVAHAQFVTGQGYAASQQRLQLREEIRVACIRRLWRVYDDLVLQGQEVAAAAWLETNYPPLLTVQIVKAYKTGDPSGFLNKPWGCASPEGMEDPIPLPE